MRRIAYVTGSRADYGPIRSTLAAIREARDLDLHLVVTGMHLVTRYGHTVDEIERDGYRISARVPGAAEGGTGAAMATGFAQAVAGLAEGLGRIRPDLVMVLGDRGEMLAAAIAAAHLNLPVAHLCGGSLSGSVDESIRHAITKFAHFHLPILETHARRIVQMGEAPSRVRAVGLPGGDVRREVTRSREETLAPFGLDREPVVLLVVQHPVTWQAEAAAQMRTTLDALLDLGHPALIGCPNSDAGSDAAFRVIEERTSSGSRLRWFPPPASREAFVNVLAAVQCLVGNSSVGMGEAMSLCHRFHCFPIYLP